ncbi:MAG: hypothetical protein ACLSIS_15750, partial [Klebsiella michiganensis]
MGLFTRLALRLAGLQIHCGLLPGAALNAPCPGYKVPAVCEPVARTDAQHRLREIQPLCALLPDDRHTNDSTLWCCRFF